MTHLVVIIVINSQLKTQRKLEHFPGSFECNYCGSDFPTMTVAVGHT